LFFWKKAKPIREIDVTIYHLAGSGWGYLIKEHQNQVRVTGSSLPKNLRLHSMQDCLMIINDILETITAEIVVIKRFTIDE
jgi:hypothetical protein